MRRLLLALALLLSPAFAAAQEPGIVPFEVAIAGLSAEDATTRGAAARELAFQGRPEATAAILAALLKPEPDPWVRKDFYASLGQLGGEGVLEALLHCLDAEDREELLGECAAALGNLADPAAIPPLLLLAERETPTDLVRLRAVDALGFFAEPAAERALIALLDSPSPEVRRHAIAALALNGGRAAAASLLQGLRQAPAADEAVLVVQVLGRMAARLDLAAAVPQLALLLGPGSSPALFAAVAQTLGQIGGDAAVSVLAASLHGLAPQQQGEVARALGRTENPLAVPSLLAELSLAVEWYLATVEAIVVEPSRSSMQRLLVMRALCEALLTTDPQGTAPVVAPLAAPTGPPTGIVVAHLQWRRVVDLRLAAINLLGADLGSSAALASLLFVAGEDVDWSMRAAAVLALGRLGRAEAVEPVVALLDPKEHRTLRWAAAMALGELGEAAALPALEKAAREDPDALVRRAAAEAAARIAQPKN